DGFVPCKRNTLLRFNIVPYGDCCGCTDPSYNCLCRSRLIVIDHEDRIRKQAVAVLLQEFAQQVLETSRPLLCPDADANMFHLLRHRKRSTSNKNEGSD